MNIKITTLFFRLIICLITLSVFESCSIFGIEKIIIRQSVFTHTDDDIIFKAKLYSIITPNDESIIFPIQSKVSTPDSYYRPNMVIKSSYRIVEYQPILLFLTKERFVLNMGCTIYGQLSKEKGNSFDIMYVENSNDCHSGEFNENETMVVKVLKASNKCSIENEILSFKRDEEVLMVYKIL